MITVYPVHNTNHCASNDIVKKKPIGNGGLGMSSDS